MTDLDDLIEQEQAERQALLDRDRSLSPLAERLDALQWVEKASCAPWNSGGDPGHVSRLMFPTSKADWHARKWEDYCQFCPVKQECGQAGEALKAREFTASGVYGGEYVFESENEREKLTSPIVHHLRTSGPRRLATKCKGAGHDLTTPGSWKAVKSGSGYYRECVECRKLTRSEKNKRDRAKLDQIRKEHGR